MCRTEKEWYKTKANKYEFHYFHSLYNHRHHHHLRTLFSNCVCTRSTFIYHIFVVIYFTQEHKMPRIFAEKNPLLLQSSVSCPNNHNFFCLFNSIKQNTSERWKNTIRKPCWLSSRMCMSVRVCLIVERVINTHSHSHSYCRFFRATI